MRPNTQPPTIRSPALNTTLIPRIIMTDLARLIARKTSKATAHFLPHADAQTVACGAATRRVRVLDAGVARVA
jgi:hypothetical protein